MNKKQIALLTLIMIVMFVFGSWQLDTIHGWFDRPSLDQQGPPAEEITQEDLDILEAETNRVIQRHKAMEREALKRNIARTESAILRYRAAYLRLKSERDNKHLVDIDRTTLKYTKDGWVEDFRVSENDEIRSAGPDKIFDNQDDIWINADGSASFDLSKVEDE